jgi:hypothetical protein
MCGVLIDEIQAVRTLRDQIGRADLADKAEERDGGLATGRFRLGELGMGSRRLETGDWRVKLGRLAWRF